MSYSDNWPEFGQTINTNWYLKLAKMFFFFFFFVVVFFFFFVFFFNL